MDADERTKTLICVVRCHLWAFPSNSLRWMLSVISCQICCNGRKSNCDSINLASYRPVRPRLFRSSNSAFENHHETKPTWRSHRNRPQLHPRHATHTGHSRAHVQHSDEQPEFVLTPQEQEIMDGKQGELLQKSIKTVVAYGQLFGATKLVDLDCAPHMAMSWGSDGVEPFLKIYKQLADGGLNTSRRLRQIPNRWILWVCR
jgi:hypothetical protein